MNAILGYLLKEFLSWLSAFVIEYATNQAKKAQRDKEIKEEAKRNTDRLKDADTEKEREDATDDLARGSI